MAHKKLSPLDSLYIWAGLSSFRLEFGGQANYMETYPKFLEDLNFNYSSNFLKLNYSSSSAISNQFFPFIAFEDMQAK